MFFVIFDSTGNCGGVFEFFEEARKCADAYMADGICAIVVDESKNIHYYNWGIQREVGVKFPQNFQGANRAEGGKNVI